MCPQVSKNTQQTKEILSSLREILYTTITTIRPTILTISVHDWLAHLCGLPQLWSSYDFSLENMIDETIVQSHPNVVQWCAYIRHHPVGINSLLYRHYLSDEVFTKEIYTDLNSTPLSLLMASMLYQDVRFGGLTTPSVWKTFKQDGSIINQFRQLKSALNQERRRLTTRDDVTEFQLDRDHALLASHSLLYGLYLVRVILIAEQAVTMDNPAQKVLSALTHTLIRLNGVLFYAED